MIKTFLLLAGFIVGVAMTNKVKDRPPVDQHVKQLQTAVKHRDCYIESHQANRGQLIVQVIDNYEYVLNNINKGDQNSSHAWIQQNYHNIVVRLSNTLKQCDKILKE